VETFARHRRSRLQTGERNQAGLGAVDATRRNLRVGWTGADELTKRYAGMGASEDPRK
jgi:hypothetical protein